MVVLCSDIGDEAELRLLRRTLTLALAAPGAGTVTGQRAVPAYELHTRWGEWFAALCTEPVTLAALRRFKTLVAQVCARRFWFAEAGTPATEGEPVLEVFELSGDAHGLESLGLKVVISGYVLSWLEENAAEP